MVAAGERDAHRCLVSIAFEADHALVGEADVIATHGFSVVAHELGGAGGEIVGWSVGHGWGSGVSDMVVERVERVRVRVGVGGGRSILYCCRAAVARRGASLFCCGRRRNFTLVLSRVKARGRCWGEEESGWVSHRDVLLVKDYG